MQCNLNNRNHNNICTPHSLVEFSQIVLDSYEGGIFGW